MIQLTLTPLMLLTLRLMEDGGMLGNSATSLATRTWKNPYEDSKYSKNLHKTFDDSNWVKPKQTI